MCSPIRFTRPGARATRTGPAVEGGGGAPNARANAAAKGVEAMRGEHPPMRKKGPERREMMPVANPGCATLVSHASLLRVHHGQLLARVIRGRHERDHPAGG